jgi:hypothetical protein
MRQQLAQPEPEGPTDEEARELANDLGITRGYFDHECGLHVSCADLAPFAHAALTRYARPAIEPVPVQPEGRQDLTWIGVAEGLRCVLRDDSEDAIQRAWQRSRILDAVDLIEANCLPVPVAERLPGPDDCDGQGRC